MSSFLRNVSVCLFVAATVVTGVSAQTLNKLSADAQVNLLFERSHAFFQKADSLCDVASCHNAIAAADASIQDGVNLKETQQFYGATRGNWHNTFDARMQDVQIELINIVRRKQGIQPISSITPRQQKPCLKTVAEVGCDQVFQAATAICSMYLAVPVTGPVLAAICEAATIYGYNKCLVATI
jgi:hypothetical protein